MPETYGVENDVPEMVMSGFQRYESRATMSATINSCAGASTSAPVHAPSHSLFSRVMPPTETSPAIAGARMPG